MIYPAPIERWAEGRRHLSDYFMRRGRERVFKEIAERIDRWDWFQEQHPRASDARLETLVQPDAVLDAIANTCACGRDLSVLGPPGTGKTTIAVAIAREYIFRGRDVAMFSAPEIAHADPDDLVAPALLIYDDFGVDADTPAGDTRLFTLFDQRWQHHKQTIVSSNLDPEAFEKRLGARVWDRIDGPLVVLEGPSRRRAFEEPECPPMAESGREFNPWTLDRISSRVYELSDEEHRRWISLILGAGMYELLGPVSVHGIEHYIEEYWQEAFVAIVREMFGDEFDDVMFPDRSRPPNTGEPADVA